MLEALREYRHLAMRKRAEGHLPSALESRLSELETAIRAAKSSSEVEARAEPKRLNPDSSPAPPAKPYERSGSQLGHGVRTTAELAIDPLALWFEIWMPNKRRRELLVWGAFSLGLSFALALPLLMGLPVTQLLGRTGYTALIFAMIGWVVVYPALLAWSELKAHKSKAHLNEPDFQVQLPWYEPGVVALLLLSSVAWILMSGLAADGLSVALGAITAHVLILTSVGLIAVYLCRRIASRVARNRAYLQYIEGSEHSLSKNNPRRARRLLERGMSNISNPDRLLEVMERYERAVFAEAEQLRHRGHDEQADALVRNLLNLRKKVSPSSTNPTSKVKFTQRSADVSVVAVRTLKERLAGRSTPKPRVEVTSKRSSTPPELLPLEGLRLSTPNTQLPKDPTRRTVYDRARTLADRDLMREAIEVLVAGRLALPPDWVKAAASQYVAQGMLRSAFLLFELLGEEQIPEFYKAAAEEWVRGIDESPECLGYGARLLDALEIRGELKVAARIAYQAATMGERASSDIRVDMARRAKACFTRLGETSPPELLELDGDLLGAADGYERSHRLEAAAKCLTYLAEGFLTKGSARNEQLIPILSRLFHLDPSIKDEHLSKLVTHVVDSHASGAVAQKILMAWRSRHPNDQKVAFRLFHLLVAADRPDDALSELTRIASTGACEPKLVVLDFRRLVESFPEHFGAREGLIRALIRSEAVEEAIRELSLVVSWGLSERTPAECEGLRRLLKTVGSSEQSSNDLCYLEGMIAEEQGDTFGAIEAYVHCLRADSCHDGAIERVKTVLKSEFEVAEEFSHQKVCVELVRLLLMTDHPGRAQSFLELLLSSPPHAEEAMILIARLKLDSGDPREGLKMLADALNGRRPTEAPHLCFELARAYELLGDMERAQKVDEALERAHVGFAAKYSIERPSIGPVDDGPNTDPSEFLIQDEAVHGGGVRPAEGQEIVTTRMEPSVTDAVHSLTLAEVLAPRYTLLRRLGSGGMGEVHLAKDQILGRDVAVKVLRRTLATDLFISKFREEARIVAQLSHPGIVGVYDIGQEGSWSYIVMEYVRGPNLATLVSSSVPPPRSQIIKYIATVADAMAYAHRRGVVHRDLKPANILVGVDGVVKVTDFGIARVLAGESEETAFSAAGLQVGTVNYMAPEQLISDRADARTDIYLLVTTLYYCLSRRYPFSGEAAQTQKTRQEAPRLSTYISGISRPLDALVARGIAREPIHRPSSMSELATALRSVPEASAGEDATELVNNNC